MSVRRMVGRPRHLLRVSVVLAALAVAATLVALLSPSKVDAVSTLPAGFQDSAVIGGMTYPTTVQFANDGRVFVAEKSGLIKEFDNLSDTTRTSPPNPTSTYSTPTTPPSGGRRPAGASQGLPRMAAPPHRGRRPTVAW